MKIRGRRNAPPTATPAARAEKADRHEIRVTAILNAPVAVVKGLYADYSGWPQVFPKITGVRLLGTRGATAVLEIDHVDGHVINELTVDDERIWLWEAKRHYDASFVSDFRPTTEGTLVTVRARIHLNGAARLARPLLGPIARRQIRKWQLRPLGDAAALRMSDGRGRVPLDHETTDEAE